MAILHIKKAQPLSDYRLRVAFDDGTRKVVDLRPLLDGVFERLRDPDVFATVEIDPQLGTVVWPSPERTAPGEPHITDLDLAPEALYELPAEEPSVA